MDSWQKNAVQSRSRKTEQSLARAARELLSERPYADIRVDEVARRAGISVGGYYARFKGKTALLHLADIDFLDDCMAAINKAIPDDFIGTREELLRAYISTMVSKFDQHRASILELMKHAEDDSNGDFRKRATSFNNFVHGKLRAIISRNPTWVRHVNPDLAVNMAIFVVSASARDAVLRGSLSAYPIEINHEGLIDELVLVATSYLGGARS